MKSEKESLGWKSLLLSVHLGMFVKHVPHFENGGEFKHHLVESRVLQKLLFWQAWIRDRVVAGTLKHHKVSMSIYN